MAVGPVPVSAEICIRSEGGFSAAENDIVQRCYDLLQQAQMSYDLKGEVYAMIRSMKGAAVASLMETELTGEMTEALTEILQARIK